jgi:hypothetical protein
MKLNFTRRLMSFEPLVRVCTKTKCRRRRPLAKMFIRLGPSGGGCAGRSKHQPYQTGAPGGSSSALLRHRFWGTGRCLHTGSESVNSELLVLGRELARRNPTLSLRLPGKLLLRLAARTFLALLFQEPPRLTRLEPVCPQT